MRSPLTLELAVSDVAAAKRFYQRAFSPDTVLDGPNGAVDIWLVAEGALVLRVVARPDGSPGDAPSPDRAYVKGRTPRLEIVADDDVDARVAKLVKLGATVARRLARGDDGALHDCAEGQPAQVAHVLDPFGHLWAIVSSDAAQDEEDLYA